MVAQSVSEINDGIVIEKQISYDIKTRFDTIKDIQSEQYITTVTYRIINNAFPRKYIELRDPSPVAGIAYDVTPTPDYDHVWRFENVGSIEENEIKYCIRKKVKLEDLSILEISSEKKEISVQVPADSAVGDDVHIIVTDEDGLPVKKINVKVSYGLLVENIKTDITGVAVFTPLDAGKYEIIVGDKINIKIDVKPLPEVELAVATIKLDEEDNMQHLAMIAGLVLLGFFVVLGLLFILRRTPESEKMSADEESGGTIPGHGADEKHEPVKEDVDEKEFGARSPQYTEETYVYPSNNDYKSPVIEQEILTEDRKDKDVYFIPPNIKLTKTKKQGRTVVHETGTSEEEKIVDDLIKTYETESKPDVLSAEHDVSEFPDVNEMKRLIAKIKRNRRRIDKLSGQESQDTEAAYDAQQKTLKKQEPTKPRAKTITIKKTKIIKKKLKPKAKARPEKYVIKKIVRKKSVKKVKPTAKPIRKPTTKPARKPTGKPSAKRRGRKKKR